MKDMRRWGTTAIALMLVMSMSVSMAAGSTIGSRGGSDRPTDDGSGSGTGLIDGLGEPEGGGGGLPRISGEIDSLALGYWKLQWMILNWLGLERRTEPMRLPRLDRGDR